MFEFSCKFALFINISSFKLYTENNANFEAVSTQANASTLVRCNFLKHIPISYYLAHIICRHLNIIHSSMNYR